MRDNKHYSEEELKLFLDPNFGKGNEKAEAEILTHLKTCPDCSKIVTKINEREWGEIRREAKGF